MSQLILAGLILSALTCGKAQEIPTPGPVTSFLLDLVSGAGAGNVPCEFYKLEADAWALVMATSTSPTGSLNTLIHPENFTDTSYKLVFETEAYYFSKGLSTFYPAIEVVFGKMDEEPHSVIISMSPYGYSAYRGHGRPEQAEGGAFALARFASVV